MENIYAQRIEALRELMRRKGLDAVVITGSDPHASEYPAPRWQQIAWLTGFTGEAADVVVTMDHAGLWTDTRYFIQAARQLQGTGVDLHKTRVPDQVLIPQWLSLWSFGEEDVPAVIAVDSLTMTRDSWNDILSAFVQAGKSEPELKSCPDLLSQIWPDRPAIPESMVMALGDGVCGESRQSKISRLREFVISQGCGSILLSSLDEIAWVLNVRGGDILYNPLVISYLQVGLSEVRWFVRKDSYATPCMESLDSFEELEQEGIAVLPYDDAPLCVAGDMSPAAPLFVDASTLNLAFWEVLDKGCLKLGTSPVPLWKSVKNPVEIMHMRRCHIDDGLAMEHFLYWLENKIESGEQVDEWQAACYLGEQRSLIDDYRGDSFETISAYGEGAALPHYATPSADAPLLERKGLYLCDSGGQYFRGTTDITRTIPLGPCSELEREDYTLVLKGHIDLAMAVFPEGTAGCQLDCLAREPLWRARRNFGHGTGHGVGFYLGVHEGPQDIRQNFNRQPLLPGMITSDEPGIYREGMHGVRHENLLLCVRDSDNQFGHWLRFEPLTLCHFDTSALVLQLLTQEEREWLNSYNRKVFETLAPLLDADTACWLAEKTRPV